MKMIKTSLFLIILFFCLGPMLGCNSEDEQPDPCLEFECFNGGTTVAGVDSCECECPDGYVGAQCETEITCVDIGCPEGQSPNPNNDCLCE
ncbi:MAG: hypothetical protein ACR2MX_01210 [Cyclobacteriaceae bacterium]